MRHRCLALLLLTLCLAASQGLRAQPLTLVELNCENLFDCRHDSLKQDTEFLPQGARHWTRSKYWRKLNAVGQAILACSDRLPSLVALCEVENDTVLHDLTRRSLLRNAGYEYLMTQSADVRGLDVALLYQPAHFRPLCYETIAVPPLKGMRPTRDILYVMGETQRGDTLRLFILHAPSRYGGRLQSQPFRLRVADVLGRSTDSILQKQVIIAGDFNDYADDKSLQRLEQRGFANITLAAKGCHGAKANYRHEGLWRSLDHILVSPTLLPAVDTAYVCDEPFLLEDEPKYGGCRPRRTFRGYRYQRGVSDHLPLVVRFLWK